jgi:hypothetical protein
MYHLFHANRRISNIFWIVCWGVGWSQIFVHHHPYPSIDSTTPTSLRYLSVLHPDINDTTIKIISPSTNINSSSRTLHSNEPIINQIATLQCHDAYGGPFDEYAQEMVYWHDIPSDANYISPLRRIALQQMSSRHDQQHQRKYLVRFFCFFSILHSYGLSVLVIRLFCSKDKRS